MNNTTTWIAPPAENIRERFQVRIEERGGKRYGVILDHGNPIHEFERSLHRMPFEPFRRLHDGQWRNYALISPQYTSFEVIDLETGERIERTPNVKEARTAELIREVGEGKRTSAFAKSIRTAKDWERGFGFCPVDFYVPDWWDLQDHDYSDAILPGDEHWDDLEDAGPDGQFGFVAGCVWGDDTSWKVQYIDLSRLHEGVVTSDDRFGYIELSPQLGLEDAVRYSRFGDRVYISTEIGFKRETGAAYDWSVRGINSPLISDEPINE